MTNSDPQPTWHNALEQLRRDVIADVTRKINAAFDTIIAADGNLPLTPPASPIAAAIADLTYDLTGLEAALDRVLTDSNDDKYRKGTEIHGKLRRAKKELDALVSRGATIDAQRDQLKALTERVLREIFTVEPPADDATN